MTDPAHEEFNDPDDGERLRRLAHALRQSAYVEEVELNPGGALDAARVELAQYTGTVPESVAVEVYDHGLAIRSVGGYMTLTVSPPEFSGGSLPEDMEVDR